MLGRQQTPLTGAPGPTAPITLPRGSSPAAWAPVVYTLRGRKLGQGRVMVESSGRSRREEKPYSEQRVPGVRDKLAGKVTVMPGPPCPGVSGGNSRAHPVLSPRAACSCSRSF